MALSANTIWEIETTGSDTLNGGAFDPSKVTAGGFADGAATSANTSAPVFSSASYNFVAGDVGAWVYIDSGTNWTPGWYKIASVAANAATLTGTIGLAVLKGSPRMRSTIVGCATVASPTGSVWSIDYSQQAAAQFAYTDLASTGTGLTISSVAFPFGKQQVGNSIVITGGTNFNTGRYVIASVVVGVATVVGPTNITTGAGVNGTGGQGGALASLGIVGGIMIIGNWILVKTGTYTISSATPNISGGCFSGVAGFLLEGYQTTRFDLGTAPLLQASGISTFTIITHTNTAGGQEINNISVDGAGLTLSRGFVIRGIGYKLTASNCTNNGFAPLAFSANFYFCVATGCSTQPAFGGGGTFGYTATSCVAFSNTVTGFEASTLGMLIRCIAYGNSGATSDGIAQTNGGNNGNFINCTSYNNGRDGFRVTGSVQCNFINCVAEANAAFGFTGGSGSDAIVLQNCATFNNTSGASSFNATGIFNKNINFITGTSTFFTNAAGNDFSLNNTIGGGASLRAAGVPGVFPAGSTTGFLDVGAVQHADPASSGGARLAGIGGLASAG